jgi:enoyl-CoA hydratase/carnithine racemase
MAGGAVLALASDLRVVTPRARLALSEMPVGIPFPEPVLDIVRAALPPEELGPAVFQGATRQGEQCVQLGWAHHLATSEAVVDDALAIARELAAFSPLAYAAAKRGLRHGLLERAERFEKQEAERYVEQLAHPDTVAAILAYMARLASQRKGGNAP